MKETFDCIIIGAGVAGTTSSIYLKRWNFNILLLEKNMPGGIISNTSIIENYPGIKKIDGSTFAMNLYEQIKELDINYKYGNASEITQKNNLFIVNTDLGNYQTKSIIIATGRTPRKLNLENEDKLIGNGISYCATCDGLLYKDKEVCVVGGGNSALEESLYLSKICKKITIINRSSKLRADEILIEKVKNTANIEVMYNSNIIKLKEKQNKLTNIIIKKENETKELLCHGLFIYIGFEPIIPNVPNLKLNDNYIVVDEKMQTNIDNICACGDIIKKDLYQIITAAGEGATAANTIKNNLNKD
jgi:thioredoxin reductase (NADPH)